MIGSSSVRLGDVSRDPAAAQEPLTNKLRAAASAPVAVPCPSPCVRGRFACCHRRARQHQIIRWRWGGTLMRHVLSPGAPATGPYRMGQAPTAARLVAPTGGTLGVISGLLRPADGTIDLTAVAAAANKHLRSTTDTHEQAGRRLLRRGLAHAWTTIKMLGI